MRFLANGPSIPDDLLIARDAGDVIFFCGAGVSRHRAGLPDFLKLGGEVIDLLGAGEKSLPRKLFRQIKDLDPISGVGGLIATDRIFSLLEREFEQRDVQNAVARAIKPSDDPDLSAHRTLIGPAPVSFRSFESDTRHRGDRIWQRYTATSSGGMRFALRSPVA